MSDISQNALQKIRIREIGSYFYFDEVQYNESKNLDGVLDSRYSYVSTCRSAIESILLRLDYKERTALVPSFTCHAVIDPFIKCGYEVYPYRIRCNLVTQAEKFMEDVEQIKPSVILIHDYFGFNTNKNLLDKRILEELMNQGITIIIDKTQSMFSKYKQLSGNYTVGSIRKWCGIPDGAFANFDIAMDGEDEELVEEKRNAMLYKARYLAYGEGDKKNLLNLYRNAECILDSRESAYAMSLESKRLLKNVDIGEMCSRRRDNYKTLINGLKERNEFSYPHSVLDDTEVPFYLPLFVSKNRKEFQTYLAENNIFATVIWGCPDEIRNKIDMVANKIYQEILCIPCDQRYGACDMEYICDVINNYSFESENKR